MWIYYLAGRFVVRDCFEPKTTHDRTLLQPVVPSQSMHCVSLTAQSLAVGASPRAGNWSWVTSERITCWMTSGLQDFTATTHKHTLWGEGCPDLSLLSRRMLQVLQSLFGVPQFLGRHQCGWRWTSQSESSSSTGVVCSLEETLTSNWGTSCDRCCKSLGFSTSGLDAVALPYPSHTETLTSRKTMQNKQVCVCSCLQVFFDAKGFVWMNTTVILLLISSPALSETCPLLWKLRSNLLKFDSLVGLCSNSEYFVVALQGQCGVRPEVDFDAREWCLLLKNHAFRGKSYFNISWKRDPNGKFGWLLHFYWPDYIFLLVQVNLKASDDKRHCVDRSTK